MTDSFKCWQKTLIPSWRKFLVPLSWPHFLLFYNQVLIVFTLRFCIKLMKGSKKHCEPMQVPELDNKTLFLKSNGNKINSFTVFFSFDQDQLVIIHWHCQTECHKIRKLTKFNGDTCRTASVDIAPQSREILQTFAWCGNKLVSHQISNICKIRRFCGVISPLVFHKSSSN